MATEAAHLFVTVTADVDKGVKNLGRVNDASQKSEGFLKGAAKQALGFGTAMIGLQAGAAVFGAIKGGAIDMNAELETSTLQFETLMGDADKARKHVESLFDFAARTPFETGPIIEASRLMETFGGSLLNTKDHLTSFGNAAAATGQPINEVAFWMSRAYAAIQAGKPWGEAAQRLGEMGVVTPQVRSKLEELQASGAKGPEVWGALTGALGKFDGAMEKQAGTLDGMVATFTDSFNMILAKALFPLFEGLKGLLKWVNALMSSPGFNGALEAASRGIAAAFSAIGDVIGAVASAFGPIIDAVGSLIDVFKSGDDVAAGFAETFDNLHEKVLEVFQGVINWVINDAVPMAANALSEFGQKFIDWVGPAAEALGAALPMIAENIINFLATNLPVIAGKLVEWGGAFIGWVGKHVLPKLPGVLAAVGGAIIGWIARTAPVVVSRIGAMAMALLAKVGQILPKLPAMMGQFLGQVVGAIVKHAPGIIGQMGSMALSLVSRFVQFAATLPGKFLGFLGNIVRALPGVGANLLRGAASAAGAFVRGFINGLGSLPGKLINTVRNAFRNLRIDIGPFHISGSGVTIDLPNIKLPSFATGAWNLPTDTIAQVHQGEMIVPRDIAERLRGGGGFGGGGANGGAMAHGDTFIFEIGQFVGTEDGIDKLSTAIADKVRLAKPRRTATAGANA